MNRRFLFAIEAVNAGLLWREGTKRGFVGKCASPYTMCYTLKSFQMDREREMSPVVRRVYFPTSDDLPNKPPDAAVGYSKTSRPFKMAFFG